MKQQFKKWLTVGSVNSKFNLFKIAILGEIILIIALTICICKINSLSIENDTLKEKIENQAIYFEELSKNVLEPLGLK